MAHLGKFYKVAFRRDLHLDVPNYSGWPEGLSIFIQNLDNPFGTWPGAAHFIGANTRIHGDVPMEWVSPDTPLLGTTFTVTVRVTMPATRRLDFIDFDLVMFENVGNLVLSMTFHVRLIQYGLFSDMNVSPVIHFVAPGYAWTHFSAIQCAPAAWAIYP